MGSNSSSTTSRTTYGNTSTDNPYVKSITNNNGTTTTFKANTAYDAINKFVNANMESVLNEYLNPTLNSTTNKSKLNSFANTLASQSAKSLENDIINPLSKRNMVRSSQATDLYKNLANSNTNAVANYANELLSNSQKDTASVIKTLLAAYLNAYGAIQDTQAQSLATSQGNATKTQNTSSASGATLSNNDIATIMALASL